MSATVLSDETPTARKEHQCSACLGTIGVGDIYRRQRIIGDGPYVYKAHSTCWNIVLWMERNDFVWDDGDGLQVEDSEIRGYLSDCFAVLGFNRRFSDMVLP